jgi:hypothetical protein
MTRLAEVFYYLLDRLDDLCYEIDDYRRESTKFQRYVAMFVLMFFLGLVFMGCSLPAGTRKVTTWGTGFIPTPTGFPLPFVGYWHSEHGDAAIGEESAKPTVPSNSGTILDEFMCKLGDRGDILHCGSYESWDRFEKEQMKKFGINARP